MLFDYHYIFMHSNSTRKILLMISQNEIELLKEYDKKIVTRFLKTNVNFEEKIVRRSLIVFNQYNLLY